MPEGLDDSANSVLSNRTKGEYCLYPQECMNIDELLEQKWEKLNPRRIYTKPNDYRFEARNYLMAYTDIDDGKVGLLWRTLTNFSLSRAFMSSACWGLGAQDIRQAGSAHHTIHASMERHSSECIRQRIFRCNAEI